MTTNVTKHTYPGQAVPVVSDPEPREEPIRMERLAAQAAEELADAPDAIGAGMADLVKFVGA